MSKNLFIPLWILMVIAVVIMSVFVSAYFYVVKISKKLINIFKPSAKDTKKEDL